MILSVGDTDTNIAMQILLSFDLPSDISADDITDAYLKIFYLLKNNDPFNAFSTSYLLGEHLTSDYTPIDGGDYKNPQFTITPTIFVATSTTPTNDWININIADKVKDDINSGRTKTQFRFFFLHKQIMITSGIIVHFS